MRGSSFSRRGTSPRGAPARRAPLFLPEEIGEKKGRGASPTLGPPVRGFMAAVACTGPAKTGSVSPPALLELTSQALPRPGAARIGITPQALIAAALYRPGPPGRRRCHAAEKPWRLWWMVRVEWRGAKTRRSFDDSAGFSTFFCRSGEKAVTPPRPPPSWCTRCSVPPAAWEIPTKSGISWGPLEMISHARGK